MSETGNPIDPFELCANCMHSARAHQGSYQGPGTAGCAAWNKCAYCAADALCSSQVVGGYTCPCEKFERIVKQTQIEQVLAERGLL